MSDNVKPWPLPTGNPASQPRRIQRPADYGLALAVINLETQLGTIEAYNRLCEAAEKMRKQIDDGAARTQNPLYAVRPLG